MDTTQLSDHHHSFEIGFNGIKGKGTLGIAGALVALVILILALAFGLPYPFA